MYSFDDFWKDYDKKVGKEKCEPKWHLLSPEEHNRIEIHVPGFVADRRNKQYRPNPLSYLNGKMWLDEKIKEEEKILLKPPREQRLSTEPAKYFDPEDGKRFIIGKIKQAYDGETYLNDVGMVYTNRLKHLLSTPQGVVLEITVMVNAEDAKPPRNRFEEKKEINVELEIRNRILKYNIDKWRENGIKIYEQI